MAKDHKTEEVNKKIIRVPTYTPKYLQSESYTMKLLLLVGNFLIKRKILNHGKKFEIDIFVVASRKYGVKFTPNGYWGY